MMNNDTIHHINSTLYLQPWVMVSTVLSCVFSVVGSLIQIIMYLTFKQLRIHSRQLLVYMSVADMLSAVALGVGAFQDFNNTTESCVAQAFFSTFFTTSSMFWLVALLIYLLVTVVTIDPERSASLILYFHTICWGVPGLFSLLALCFKGFGNTHSLVSVGWCWIKVDDPETLFWMLVTEKLWEFVAFICVIAFSASIRIQISRKRSNKDLDYLPIGIAEAMRKIRQKVVFIPLLFILLRIWGVVRFVLFIQKSPYVRNSTLMVLQGIGSTGQGFANFVLFCLCTTKTREAMIINKTCLKKLFCCEECSLISLNESKPLLQEEHDPSIKTNLSVYFKGGSFNDDNGSVYSFSQSAQIYHTYLK